MKKRIMSLLLTIILTISIAYNQVAYATGAGAEGLIGGAAAGLGLTGPQTALVIAGLFGIYYTIEHADDTYKTMCACISNAMDGVDGAADKISAWWADACDGVLDTTSQVWDGICSWFETESKAMRETVIITPADVGVITQTSKLSYINYQRGNTYISANAGYEIPYLEYIYTMKNYNDTYWCGRVYYSTEIFCLSQYWNDGTHYMGMSPTKYTDLGLYVYVDVDVISSIDIDEGYLATYLPNVLDFGVIDGFDYILELVFKIAEGTNEFVMGGIDKVINGNEAIDTPIDDIVYPDAIPLNPAISIDDLYANLLERVRTGEMSWADYWEQVAVDAKPGAKTEIGVYVIDDAGVTDIPWTYSPSIDTDIDVDIPSINGSLNSYKTDGLTSLFPFCIPFDLINCIRMLAATGAAPHWEFSFYVPVLGLEETIVVDLSKWDAIAAICRSTETLLFIGLLISRTRDLIRG